MGMIVNPYWSGSGGTPPTFTFESDIIHWWDASEGVALSGSDIVTWTDKIGGVDFTPQVSGDDAVTISTLNSEPAIQCANGGGCFAPFISADSTITFIFIGTHVANIAGGRILSVGGTTGFDYNAVGRVMLQRNGSTDDVTMWRNSLNTGADDVGGYDTPFVAIMDLNGTNTILYLNAVSAGSLAVNGALSTDRIGLFASAALANEPGAGKAADVIVVNRALNGTEIAEVQTYAAKYGL